MADSNILSDFGINILEEEIDDVIFQTNERVPYRCHIHRFTRTVLVDSPNVHGSRCSVLYCSGRKYSL